MKCRWILENDVFEEGQERLIAALEANGNPYKCVKYFSVLEQGDSADYGFSPDDGPTVFYGSLNMAKYITHKTHFLPGPICNLNNFLYTTYAPYFGNLLLNNDWFCLPLREAIRQKDLIFKIFSGEDYHWTDCVFVRPVAGDKPFSGKILSYEKFNLDGFYYGFYFEDADLPIVISSAKSIGRELRYFVADKTILSFSEYGKHKGNPVFDLKNPENFVQKVLQTIDWSPDPVYTIDICETPEGWRIAEINSASCSGMYECNPLPIIKGMSAAAEREWESYYEA
jgi:hypothetical protein